MWPWKRRKPEEQKPPEQQKTIIEIREDRVPFQLWRSQVYYDAFGTPYARCRLGLNYKLIPDYNYRDAGGMRGKCPGVFNTQWIVVSGPPVTMGKHPGENLFAANPS